MWIGFIWIRVGSIYFEESNKIFVLIKDWEFVDHLDPFQLLLKNSSPVKLVVLLKAYDQKRGITFVPINCR
jgi:hypothetical protein